MDTSSCVPIIYKAGTSVDWHFVLKLAWFDMWGKVCILFVLLPKNICEFLYQCWDRRKRGGNIIWLIWWFMTAQLETVQVLNTLILVLEKIIGFLDWAVSKHESPWTFSFGSLLSEREKKKIQGACQFYTPLI